MKFFEINTIRDNLGSYLTKLYAQCGFTKLNKYGFPFFIFSVIRGAFDRVSPVNDVISIKQCQRALSYLGYAQSLLNLDNINKIVLSQRESLNSLQKKNATNCSNSDGGNNSTNCVKNQRSAVSNVCLPSSSSTLSTDAQNLLIDFDLFCVVSAYLSVLQQEIHESGCISPIKGTNLPPPPVYLTNMQGNTFIATSANIFSLISFCFVLFFLLKVTKVLQ